MRITFSDLCSRLAFALVAALLFIAPSGQAYAQSRSFQMALWAGAIDDVPRSDTDIPVFYDGEDQPRGFSILINFNWQSPVSAHRPYDWARILAVLVDEPYNDFNNVPCPLEADVVARVQVLADRASELKSVAPLTRFWVNLAKPQVDWMMASLCTDEGSRPVYVNAPYIDVISVDIYHTPFNPGVKKYYDWLTLWRAKPDQQVALIPGTFYLQGKDSPATQASYLQGYFDYANNANQSCDLPYGSRGLTGSFDGCRVWIVLGWLAPNWTVGGYAYKGERDPTSWQIADVWQRQLALPLRPDLAHQVTPGELIPTLLPLFLD